MRDRFADTSVVPIPQCKAMVTIVRNGAEPPAGLEQPNENLDNTS